MSTKIYLPIFIIFRKIFKKILSYFFKIIFKNSKIDHKTKSFGYDMEKILKDNEKKGFCPTFIINIFNLIFNRRVDDRRLVTFCVPKIWLAHQG